MSTIDSDEAGDDEVEVEAEDEFGAEDGEEPLGRSMKAEAVRLQKKVLEMQKLVTKARKLKESKQRA